MKEKELRPFVEILFKVNNYELFDLDNDKIMISEKQYQKLLKQQLLWLNENYIQVINKAYKLYDLYNKGKLSENIRIRCCNFPLLEEKCELYEDSHMMIGV